MQGEDLTSGQILIAALLPVIPIVMLAICGLCDWLCEWFGEETGDVASDD